MAEPNKIPCISLLNRGISAPIFVNQPPGEQLGIARAILRDAPILLLDEPTSALDARGEERFLAALRNWVASRPQQRMVLIATHGGRTATTADRTYRIVAGQLAPAPKPRLAGESASRGVS